MHNFNAVLPASLRFEDLEHQQRLEQQLELQQRLSSPAVASPEPLASDAVHKQSTRTEQPPLAGPVVGQEASLVLPALRVSSRPRGAQLDSVELVAPLEEEQTPAEQAILDDASVEDDDEERLG